MSLTDDFCAEHFTLGSISPRRQWQVRVAFDRLAAYMDGPIENATDNDLRLWMASMMEAGAAASTTAFYLKAVKPFYRWLWLQRQITADDWMRLKEVRPPRGSDSALPKPYTRKEIARMWAELDARYPFATERIVQRWRNGTSPYLGNVKAHAMRIQLEAIIELALVCGLRKSEIYNLGFDDVHWDNAYIVVHGKRVDQNDKVREVPYPDSTREAMKRWFRMRALMSPQPGLRIWLSVTGAEPATELRPERMDNILHSFGDWTMHRLRHTAATERLRAGMELEKLQRLLGHSNISMTLRYAQLVTGDIHKAAIKQDAEFQRAIGRPRYVTPPKLTQQPTTQEVHA